MTFKLICLSRTITICFLWKAKTTSFNFAFICLLCLLIYVRKLILFHLLLLSQAFFFEKNDFFHSQYIFCCLMLTFFKKNNFMYVFYILQNTGVLLVTASEKCEKGKFNFDSDSHLVKYLFCCKSKT